MNQRPNPPMIPFIDVAAQRRRLGGAIDAAVARVLGHCQFILGPEVRAFDAVFCPSFTFCATAEVAALVGATPIFVDVEAESFNIDAKGLTAALATAKRLGLTPKAVIPVDLFGLAADHAAVAAAAEAEGLFILDDAAQAFGATFNNRRLGTFGHATATSFF